ncbi:MAG: 23S rRNA pseudouridine(1911/1915/1917) synthase RluD [Pseudomonadota bacterium]
MTTRITAHATVPPELAFERLDRTAADLFPAYSRSRLQAWIKSGDLTVDGELRRPRDKVWGGEELEIDATLEGGGVAGEDLALDVVHEDEAILVINKPAGLVVHPGAGNPTGTLMNALLYHDPTLAVVPRAGIVHRLDKETSGLLVVAKSLASQNSLVQQLQAREVSRIYEAVVYGVVPANGRIDAPIARNPANRIKMAVQPSGKEATTHYRVCRAFAEHTHLELKLETGRTHQIRVHMQHLGHPLVGDPTYGGSYKEPRNKRKRLEQALKHMGRQALHARKLSFVHPLAGTTVSFESALPSDIVDLLAALAEESDA